jgi:hypothetical protein
LNLSIEPVDDEPQRDAWPGVAALLLAAFLAVIVFLPPEGRIAVPLHQAFAALLGRATFMLPIGVAFVGVLLVACRIRPDVCLPRRRLAGVGAILLAVIPAEHLLGNNGDGTGLVGKWLSGSLLDLLGGAGTLLVLAALLGVGTFLAFDVRLTTLTRLTTHTKATEAPHAES